jgi:hypothetical protein
LYGRAFMNVKAPALGRPLDWSIPSNRFIVGLTPLAGSVAGLVALLAGDSLWDAIGWGVSTGGASFLAWAVGRELHPDRVWIATLAAFLAPIGLVWGRPDLLTTASILLVARAVAGTSGRTLRWSDVMLFVAVGAPIVVRTAGPPALAVGSAGVVLSLLWSRRRWVISVTVAAAYAVGSSVGFLVTDLPGLPDGDVWILFWIGLAGGVVSLFGPGSVESVEDRRNGATLRRVRVWSGRLVAVVAATTVSLTSDPAALAPVWAAVVATAVRPR